MRGDFLSSLSIILTFTVVRDNCIFAIDHPEDFVNLLAGMTIYELTLPAEQSAIILISSSITAAQLNKDNLLLCDEFLILIIYCVASYE